MRDHLTPDEADHVMANIHPASRRWCIVGCGLRPTDDPALLPSTMGCACSGCIYRALTWDEFEAWEAREAQREPTPHIDWEEPQPLDLWQRLASYKHRKRLAREVTVTPQAAQR